MEFRLKSQDLYRLGIFLIIYGNLAFQYVPVLSYLLDIINAVAIVFILKRRHKRIRAPFNTISVPLFLLCCVILCGLVINSYPITRFFWGLRNNCRFFVWFFFIYECIHDEELARLETLLTTSFKIHIILTVIQYLLGYNQDTLGGIFGTVVGSNGALCIYLIIVLLYELKAYIEKEIALGKMVCVIAIILFNSALAEVKVLFILVPLFIVLYYTSSKYKQKLFFVIAGTVCILPVALNILITMFPEYVSYFSIDNIIRQLTDTNATYSTVNDIGRSAVFTKIPEIVYNWTNSRVNTLIGIGLGNADYSSTFSSLNSDFYRIYGFTHYTWFMSAMMLIETGYMGVILYLLVFLALFIYLYTIYRKTKESKYQIGFLICILAVIMFFYNSTLRMGYGYLIFTILANACAASKNMHDHCAEKNNWD